jgi:hypothetical protein
VDAWRDSLLLDKSWIGGIGEANICVWEQRITSVETIRPSEPHLGPSAQIADWRIAYNSFSKQLTTRKGIHLTMPTMWLSDMQSESFENIYPY